MKKTKWFAYITQHEGNRNDSFKRRVWEDEQHQHFIKVNGCWFELNWYKNKPHIFDVFVDIE